MRRVLVGARAGASALTWWDGWLIAVPIAGGLVFAWAAGQLQGAGFAVSDPEAALSILTAVAFAFPSIAAAILYRRDRRTRNALAEADCDALTGVLSRGAMTVRMSRTFAERERQGFDIGIWYIDVDNFKRINDRHGHDFGDQYLRFIAGQISAHVRDRDLVGRMGGDEFVVVLPDIDRGLMRSIADRLVEAVKAPFTAQGITIHGGISVGCHLSPSGEALNAALDQADSAAYQAKALGRGRVAEFSASLLKARRRRNEIAAAITRAASTDAFDLHFQPVFAVGDRRITGFETVLRLSLPDGELLDPAEVLPVAEATGLIAPLGERILDRAVTAAAGWPKEIDLSVNLSPVQFRDGGLTEMVLGVLQFHGVAAERLTLNVTERIGSEGGELVDETFAALREAGIDIAIDDFGGGDASLAPLWTHRFDRIKVDGVLQEAFAFEPDRYRPLFEIIADLGHRLDLPVTLKGVESAEQAKLAEDLGCACYQGPWLSRPLTAEAALDLVGLTGRSRSDTKWV